MSEKQNPPYWEETYRIVGGYEDDSIDTYYQIEWSIRLRNPDTGELTLEIAGRSFKDLDDAQKEVRGWIAQAAMGIRIWRDKASDK